MSFRDWRLADLKPPTGPTVFSCFHCGGGSTMGYKLAGMKVLGGVDIDPRMVELYRKNHNPKLSFGEGIIEFNKIAASTGIVCDILDGSPPCSSFSTSGNRDDDWGKKKKFKEGQAPQRLDDLFFDFIETARILKPKVVIAENVKGIITGKAKGYAKAIVRGFNAIGYECRIFLLCASRFGVPQRRQRVFFISVLEEHADAFFGALKFIEDDHETNFEEIDDGENVQRHPVVPSVIDAVRWGAVTGGNIDDYFKAKFGKVKFWDHHVVRKNRPMSTIAASSSFSHWSARGMLTDNEIRKAQSFPIDYDFNGQRVQYVAGMSVPPMMMKRVAEAVHRSMAAAGLLDSAAPKKAKPAPAPKAKVARGKTATR